VLLGNQIVDVWGALFHVRKGPRPASPSGQLEYQREVSFGAEPGAGGSFE
jgi:hypothetical protein